MLTIVPVLLPGAALCVGGAALWGYCFCSHFIHPCEAGLLFPPDSWHLLRPLPVQHTNTLWGGRWSGRWIRCQSALYVTAAPRRREQQSCNVGAVFCRQLGTWAKGVGDREVCRGGDVAICSVCLTPQHVRPASFLGVTLVDPWSELLWVAVSCRLSMLLRLVAYCLFSSLSRLCCTSAPTPELGSPGFAHLHVAG